MTFPVLTVRSQDDQDSDLLFPVLAEPGSGRVTALSPLDGTPTSFVANGVTVTRVVEDKHHKGIELVDVRIDVDVTACRVILGCQNYDKGGGWAGFGAGALVAAAANGVSKARASSRRQGKALVGHVRYPWLYQVGGFNKQGWTTTEQFRMTFKETLSDGGALIILTLTLPQPTNSMLIAQDVVRRAATWRLSNNLFTDQDQRQSLERLQRSELLNAQPKAFSIYALPNFLRVGATAAEAPQPQAPQSPGREV